MLSKLCLYLQQHSYKLLPNEAKFFDSSASFLGKENKFNSVANVNYLLCLAWASKPNIWCDIEESLKKRLFEDQGLSF